MSYFSLSSSSSTPCNTPILGVIQQESPSDALAKWKSALTALPAGMATSARARAPRSKKSRKGRIIDLVTSKAYNTYASRPISRSRNIEQIYVANLRLDNASILVTSVTVPTFGSNAFSLNDFPNRTLYTGLFDQYMITEFEVWIEPIQSQSVTAASVGYYTTAVDLDDATTPSTVSSVEGKQNSLSTGGLDGHYHKFQPHMAIAAYSGAFTSFSNSPPMWIDSGSPSVQHYGLKYAASITSAVMTYQLSLRAKVLFKQAGI